MPIKGAKYRVKTTSTGKKVRLAFVQGEVVEAKNVKTGATHSSEELLKGKKRKVTRGKGK